MSDSSRLGRAQLLLAEAYGRHEVADDEATWPRFLRLLLGIDAKHRASAALDSLLNESALSSPGQTAALSVGQVAELLQPIPRGPQKGAVVRSLAEWWMNEFGDCPAPEWPTSFESCRQALRQIRGLGPATVDELLLLGAGRRVFPLDRTALRVAVRHGWLDLPLEEDEARSFFLAGDPSISDLQQLSLSVAQVGAKHCGREPICDGCPLQSMLPPGGPLNPGGC